MAETKRETEHKAAHDHGEDVQPQRVLCDVAGWLYNPKNPIPYTGENRPWRQT